MDKKILGKIVHIGGPVVDVEFDGTHLPKIKDALILDKPNDQRVMEVASHLGDNTVRCIMLQSSDGLYKGMKVVSTGSPIKVPVGKKTLGRLFNVTGQTLDDGEDLSGETKWSILLALR